MKSKLFILAALFMALVAVVAQAEVKSVPGIAVDNTTVDASSWVVFDDVWYKCVGIEAKATKPFRYKAFDANASSNTVYCPVDTTMMAGAITAGAIAYPVVLSFRAAMDSIKFAPGASDTIWYHLLYE